MSGSDVAGLISAINSRDNGNFFGDGIWGIIMLLIVAGIFTGGWGGFGGGRCGTNSAVTEEYIANQFTQRDIFNTNTDVLNNKYANAVAMADVSKDVLENRYNAQICCCNTQKEVLQNRYENALATAGLQKDILLGNCDIKTAVLADGEKTRAMITEQYINNLLEKVNDLKAQVNNEAQSRFLLNTMGRWHAYPSCACGYGMCNSANLI